MAFPSRYMVYHRIYYYEEGNNQKAYFNIAKITQEIGKIKLKQSICLYIICIKGFFADPKDEKHCLPNILPLTFRISDIK